MNARGGLAVSKKVLKKEKKGKSESKGKGTATAVNPGKHETGGGSMLCFTFFL